MQPISFTFFICFYLFIFQLSLVSVHFPGRFVHFSLVFIAFSVSFREFNCHIGAFCGQEVRQRNCIENTVNFQNKTPCRLRRALLLNAVGDRAAWET